MYCHFQASKFHVDYGIDWLASLKSVDAFVWSLNPFDLFEKLIRKIQWRIKIRMFIIKILLNTIYANFMMFFPLVLWFIINTPTKRYHIHRLVVVQSIWSVVHHCLSHEFDNLIGKSIQIWLHFITIMIVSHRKRSRKILL